MPLPPNFYRGTFANDRAPAALDMQPLNSFFAQRRQMAQQQGQFEDNLAFQGQQNDLQRGLTQKLATDQLEATQAAAREKRRQELMKGFQEAMDGGFFDRAKAIADMMEAEGYGTRFRPGSEIARQDPYATAAPSGASVRQPPAPPPPAAPSEPIEAPPGITIPDVSLDEKGGVPAVNPSIMRGISADSLQGAPPPTAEQPPSPQGPPQGAPPPVAVDPTEPYEPEGQAPGPYPPGAHRWQMRDREGRVIAEYNADERMKRWSVQVEHALRPLYDNAVTPDELDAARTAVEIGKQYMAQSPGVTPKEAAEKGYEMYHKILGRKAMVEAQLGAAEAKRRGMAAMAGRHQDQNRRWAVDKLDQYVRETSQAYDVSGRKQGIQAAKQQLANLKTETALADITQLGATIVQIFGSRPSDAEREAVMAAVNKMEGLKMKVQQWISTAPKGVRLPENFVKQMEQIIEIAAEASRNTIRQAAEEAGARVANERAIADYYGAANPGEVAKKAVLGAAGLYVNNPTPLTSGQSRLQSAEKPDADTVAESAPKAPPQNDADEDFDALMQDLMP